jgi:hypothetical protein
VEAGLGCTNRVSAIMCVRGRLRRFGSLAPNQEIQLARRMPQSDKVQDITSFEPASIDDPTVWRPPSRTLCRPASHLSLSARSLALG